MKHSVKSLLSLAICAALTAGFLPQPALLEKETVSAASFDYPVQQFRMGISDTNRNVNISAAEAGSPVTSEKINGTDNENWYLNYISEGEYEIVSAANDYVLTAESGYCTIAPDTDAANQRWNITAVVQDFEGYDLYYKITSNADAAQALTFTPETNSFALESYTGAAYQQFKLNLKGLEGFAANAMTPGGEKAGTIGGLLGETVFVDTVEECVAAMKRTEPLTIVVTANLEFGSWSKEDQKIEDDKTILGSYSANMIYDSQWRNDDFYGSEDILPSNNIVFQNLHFQAKTLSNKCGVILVYIYCGRNIWFDHNDFSATFGHDRDNEVGKFIWINTPVANWSDGCYNGISPDYITISYNHFNNRYWTVAYGTQNTETTRDRTTLMFNKWENCARRTPQIGNGTGHVYNSYHTYSISDPSQQIIAGDGCTMLTEYCYFEGLKGLEFAGGGASNSPFRDTGSVSASSVGGSASAMNQSFSYSHTWNPGTENYGYTLISANHTKDFCNAYSGSVTKLSDMKYVTDSDLSGWVMTTYPTPFLKDIEVGALSTSKTGTLFNTANRYTFRNVGSGQFLTVDGTAQAGADVVQDSAVMSDANTWTLRESGNDDGYYYIISALGDGTTYYLDVADMSADNGANIGIWTDTACDAQLFKFVESDKGVYQIVTKTTRDAGCIGIIGGSSDTGASAVQWQCDGSANQQWFVEIQGELFQNLQVYDAATTYAWAVNPDTSIGDPLFGDRTTTYLTLPEALVGAESLMTACDAKNLSDSLATFTAGADMTVYVALDERVTNPPSWLGDWTRTDMTLSYNTDFSFHIYEKSIEAGLDVMLGSNGQSTGCVNYTVFAVEDAEAPTEPPTAEPTDAPTEPPTAEPTTEGPTAEPTTEPVSEVLYGDVDLNGSVNITDVIVLSRNLMGGGEPLNAQQSVNSDCDANGTINTGDALAIMKFLVKLVDALPIA